MKRIATALVLTVTLGVLSRKIHIGMWGFDKSLGDVLYVAAIYLLIVILTRWPSHRAAPSAFAFAVCVELFKLTGLPMAWRDFWLSRWLLGSVFSWHNILCYVLGTTIITLLDHHVLRPTRGRISRVELAASTGRSRNVVSDGGAVRASSAATAERRRVMASASSVWP